jgi:hypothetical protein
MPASDRCASSGDRNMTMARPYVGLARNPQINPVRTHPGFRIGPDSDSISSLSSGRLVHVLHDRVPGEEPEGNSGD